MLDVDTVLIATPAVNIEQINFSADNERLVDLENTIRNDLISLATKELTARGLEIIDFDLAAAN